MMRARLGINIEALGIGLRDQWRLIRISSGIVNLDALYTLRLEIPTYLAADLLQFSAGFGSTRVDKLDLGLVDSWQRSEHRSERRTEGGGIFFTTVFRHN